MSVLSSHVVHIWHTRFEDHAEKYQLYQSWLAPEEKIRAEKLTLHYQQKFIISRAVLRDILAYYSEQSPQDLKLSYSTSGKPSLINSDQCLEFNVSHSKNILIYAFTLETPVGIDIEYIHHRNYLDKIAYRFFSASDYDRLQLLEPKKKLKEFFTAWVRNEAIIKAKGSLLKTHPYSRYELRLSSNLDPSEYVKNEINTFYSISNLSLYSDFATAVALKGNKKSFIMKKYIKKLSLVN